MAREQAMDRIARAAKAGLTYPGQHKDVSDLFFDVAINHPHPKIAEHSYEVHRILEHKKKPDNQN